jgi:hypothetical protein
MKPLFKMGWLTLLRLEAESKYLCLLSVGGLVARLVFVWLVVMDPGAWLGLVWLEDFIFSFTLANNWLIVETS